MKLNQTHRQILAFLLSNQASPKFKLSAFNISKSIDKDNIYVSHQIRDLISLGLIRKSIGGAFFIPPNKEKEILEILKGENESIL